VPVVCVDAFETPDKILESETFLNLGAVVDINIIIK
jgi:hypothetical protein